VADFGYGSDVWTGESMVTGRFSRGATHVMLSMYRRLITPKGTLRPLDEDSNEDESDYGFDVAQYCGAVGPELAVLTAPMRMQAELKKDDRQADVAVTASYAYKSDGTADIFFVVSVVLKGSNERFTFTVKIANLTASLLLGGAS
jgi:hypothetical protein